MRIPARKSASAKSDRPAATDWAAVRARLEQAAAARAGDEEGTPTAAAEELARRARAVARPWSAERVQAAPGGEATEVVVFQLGSQRCGVEAARVKEVVQVAQLTPLPGLPDTFKGLANIRSRIVAVFDVRGLLQLARETAAAAQATVLILSQDGTELGVIADAIVGAELVPASRLRTEVPALQMQYLRGVTDGGLLMLDVPALVAALTPDGRSA